MDKKDKRVLNMLHRKLHYVNILLNRTNDTLRTINDKLDVAREGTERYDDLLKQYDVAVRRLNKIKGYFWSLESVYQRVGNKIYTDKKLKNKFDKDNFTFRLRRSKQTDPRKK